MCCSSEVAGTQADTGDPGFGAFKEEGVANGSGRAERFPPAGPGGFHVSLRLGQV